MAVSACGGDGSAESRTGAGQVISAAQLHRIDDRIYDEGPELARLGVYVSGHGVEPTRRCVDVDLYNPSQPNRVYLRKRFGEHLCIDPRPGSQLLGCAAPSARRAPRGAITVPDVRAARFVAAKRQLRALHLRYTLDCLSAVARDVTLDPRTPQALARVIRQCPSPGERVRAGTPVALEISALLPGGYEYRAGWLSSGNAFGVERGCRARRDPLRR